MWGSRWAFFIRFSGPIHHVPDVLHAFHVVFLMFRRMGSRALSLILAICVSWDRYFFLPSLAWNCQAPPLGPSAGCLHYVASGIHYSISTKVTYNEYISIFWGIFTGSLYIYW